MKKTVFIILGFLVAILCSSTAFAMTEPCQHEWILVEQENPTYSNPGFKDYECEYCVATKHEIVPKRTMNVKQKKAVRPLLNFMAAAKAYNSRKILKCFASKLHDPFSGRKTIKKIFRKYNKKYLSHDILVIKAGSKKGSIKVSIESPNLDDAFDKAYSAVLRYTNRHPNISQKAANKYLDKKIKRYAKKYKHSIDEIDLRVKTIKTKKGWKIKKYNSRLLNCIDCDYDAFFEGL